MAASDPAASAAPASPTGASGADCASPSAHVDRPNVSRASLAIAAFSTVVE